MLVTPTVQEKYNPSRLLKGTSVTVQESQGTEIEMYGVYMSYAVLGLIHLYGIVGSLVAYKVGKSQKDSCDEIKWCSDLIEKIAIEQGESIDQVT